MPLIGEKSQLIQNHDRTGDEPEMLARATQFETGLTGTPYATCRTENERINKLYQLDMGKLCEWQLSI